MTKTALLPAVRVEEDFRNEIVKICSKENRSLGNLIETALIEYKKNHYENKQRSGTTRKTI